MRQTRYTGRPVGTKPAPSKTFAIGRVCRVEGCVTQLSTYNADETCWQHTEARPERLVVRPRKSA